MHHMRVISQDLARTGEFVEACIRPSQVEGVMPKRHRADPVEGRRLVEPDVGVGVYPVSTGGMAAIDHRHRRV